MLLIKNLSVGVETTNQTNSKESSKKEILRKISVNFAEGKIYAILGPNGSGKSTLASVIAGDPTFVVAGESQILLDGKNITNQAPDARAQSGIFLSFQNPPEIPGVTVRDIIRAACTGQKRSALAIKQQLEQFAQKLQIPAELLNRSINEGFSGGQRKKMEVLQMAMLDPRYIILDEIDTGVDIDALKTITKFIAEFVANTDKTLITITHHHTTLPNLTPDTVIILNDGQIAQTGDHTLIAQIAQSGFTDKSDNNS